MQRDFEDSKNTLIGEYSKLVTSKSNKFYLIEMAKILGF